MKKLNTIQKREKLNDIHIADEKGNGGANHKYIISKENNIYGEINFQNGARNLETSTHGIIDTDLLEIVRHRLQSFQQGTFASEYNAKALEHLEIALMYMNRRVEDRIERKILGINKMV